MFVILCCWTSRKRHVWYIHERQGSGMFDIFMNLKETACLLCSWSREQYVWTSRERHVWYIHDQGSSMFERQGSDMFVIFMIKGAACLLYSWSREQHVWYIHERQGSGMFDIFMNVKGATCLEYIKHAAPLTFMNISNMPLPWRSWIYQTCRSLDVHEYIKHVAPLTFMNISNMPRTSKKWHVWYIHERQGSSLFVMFLMRTSLQTINKHMKSLKITKRQSEAVSRRKTDKTTQWPKQNNKSTNNDIQNTTQKTKVWAVRIPLLSGELTLLSSNSS
jgi:hypothetical protein